MGTASADDGTRIAFYEWGNRAGEPLLFVQGLGADSKGWMMQARRFGRRFRCIAVDNRGVGRSGRPPGPYDMEVMATDLVAVLDRLGVGSAHVVGCSMGGVLAQIMGVRHAERVRSLTLACTACRHLDWRRELLEGWASQARTHGMPSFINQHSHWIAGARSVRGLKALQPFTRLVTGRIDSAPFVAQVEAILNMDDALREELGTITVPTLVLVGSRDVLTPMADSEEIASRIPGAELAVMRGASHAFMFENARAFNTTVLDFHDRRFGPAEVEADVIDLTERRHAATHPAEAAAIAPAASDVLDLVGRRIDFADTEVIDLTDLADTEVVG